MRKKSFNRLSRLFGVAVGLSLAYYGYSSVVPIQGVIGVVWTIACLVLAAINAWYAIRNR